MSKFKKRVNKLLSKTHFTLSPNELRLLYDYHRSQLDEVNLKPEDFSEDIEKIRVCLRDPSLSEIERFQRIKAITENDLVTDAWGCELARNLLDKNPYGALVKKSVGRRLIQTLEDAKSYFKERETGFTSRTQF